MSTMKLNVVLHLESVMVVNKQDKQAVDPLLGLLV
jgi:hypothetical protein